jgi:hypothetical protein
MASTIGSIASTIETIQMRVERATPAHHAAHEHPHHGVLRAVHDMPHAVDLPHAIAFHGGGEAPEIMFIGDGADAERVLLAISGEALAGGAPGKRVGAPSGRGEPDASPVIAGRTISVGLAYSLKPDPRRAAWTLQLAPAGATPRHVARIIDADGRSMGMVMPLGVDRGDLGGGPFVLPGRESMGRQGVPGVLTGPRLPLAP